MTTLGRKEIKLINTDTLRSLKLLRSSNSLTTLDSLNPLNLSRPCSILSNTKSSKDTFTEAKVHKKFMDTIKENISDKNLENTSYAKQFDQFFVNVTTIYTQIEQEWFWISHGDKLSQFTRAKTDLETHKTKFFYNCSLLEKIVKKYGFTS